jgi:integral membrane protein
LQPGRDDACRLELAQLRQLEITSVLEATTLVVLVCIAVPLKHVGHYDLAVRIMGPVHGLAFLAYAWTALQTVAGGGWSPGAAARLFLTAFIPFAGFTTPTFLRARAAALAAK